MSLQDRIEQHFTQNALTQQEALLNLSEIIEFASLRLVATLLNDNKILTCGNGGSALNATQFVVKMLNRFDRERPSLPAFALTTDTSTITSIANDLLFDDVYAKQIRALGQSGDILLLYTASGNSANMVKAVSAAHDKDISVIALTGQEGGMLAPIFNETDIVVRVPSNIRHRIQETHLLITHCLLDLVDQQLFGDNSPSR